MNEHLKGQWHDFVFFYHRTTSLDPIDTSRQFLWFWRTFSVLIIFIIVSTMYLSLGSQFKFPSPCPYPANAVPVPMPIARTHVHELKLFCTKVLKMCQYCRSSVCLSKKVWDSTKWSSTIIAPYSGGLATCLSGGVSPSPSLNHRHALALITVKYAHLFSSL
jgi:hypothetical protein